MSAHDIRPGDTVGEVRVGAYDRIRFFSLARVKGADTDEYRVSWNGGFMEITEDTVRSFLADASVLLDEPAR